MSPEYKYKSRWLFQSDEEYLRALREEQETNPYIWRFFLPIDAAYAFHHSESNHEVTFMVDWLRENMDDPKYLMRYTKNGVVLWLKHQHQAAIFRLTWC